ncbi:MAG: hypothetical protein A2804_01040 [Candidatus Pacebacteria bacterium RIFCSPHIGHO2_01_FULL_46_10]|nr:MAG: hypothetical protein A2804_01040 [Candidatus Pacebacteria bacterium RIFCSPHIGHO2_01_FULL_46_10]
MQISHEQLQMFQDALSQVAGGLPTHVREGVLDTIHVQIQNEVNKTTAAAAKGIVRQNQGTYDSYAVEFAAANITAEQLVSFLITVGINSGDWAQTINLFRTA